MIVAYALVTAENRIDLGTIRSTRLEAKKLLDAEFPRGHVIYPNCRVVEIRIDVVPE